MKNFKINVAVMLLCLAFSNAGNATEPNLPRIEILGKEYYYHEVKKGESLYGIAKEYGWDADELFRLNPKAANHLEKGVRLYYPTGRVAVIKEIDENKQPESVITEPIRHTVKKGENVYSIAKLYSLSPDRIYASNPSSKHGVKPGDELVIEQNAPGYTGGYIYYTIRRGDTLYAVSRAYGTDVESILASNPGVSEQNFRAGDIIRIPAVKENRHLHTELVEEEQLTGIESYKVKKNDTWSSISQSTGVEEDLLRQANSNVVVPEKNAVINVPIVEQVSYEKEVNDMDPREESSAGRQEMYDSIHKVDSDILLLPEVKVAVMLDEPTSKKDIDFTRGFLLGLNELKDSPYKINIKVIDGRGSTQSLTDTLDMYSPNLLIATADKAFPAFLADYGAQNQIEIVNAFDVKSELYEDNPSIVQILTPSALFNDQVSERLIDDHGKKEWIFTGTPDNNDILASLLLEKLGKENVKTMPVSDFAEMQLDNSKEYAIYSYSQKKEEIHELLGVISHLKESNPMAGINVIGRASWIMHTDQFRDRFNDGTVLVPARCWIDLENGDGKEFADKFEAQYGQEPVKSFPNYAAEGYDIARYFIDTTAKNGGDLNKIVDVDSNGLQTDFRLKRLSNWSGFLNPVSYIIRFSPYNTVDKTRIIN